MNHLPKMLLDIKNNKNVIAEFKLRCSEIKDSDTIYCYDITNKLIEFVGRFCESYQSDMLVTWNSIINKIKTDSDGIYCFGIRRNGVDGNSFLFQRFRDGHPSAMTEFYRKILAVEFHKTKEYNEDVVNIQLKDVTGTLRFLIDDKDYNMSLIDTIVEVQS